jgi:molybdenum cofactor biosynthesis protein B
MSVEEHRAEAPARVGYALVTVSDTRDEASDVGGATLAAKVATAGAAVSSRRIVRDEEAAIRHAVREALAEDATDVVLVTGGTGVAPRDITIEALRQLIDKELPGFGELFRMLSYAEVGSAAMLSRAMAGVVDGKALFVLPGSPRAVELALDRLVLPEAAHLLSQARRPD